MARKPRSRTPASPAGSPPVRNAAVAPETGPVPAQARTFILGPALTISGAETLRAELLAMVESGGDVCVDGSAVETVDTAGMQVLVAFRRALQGRNRSLNWSGCSPALMDVSGLLGLQAQIGVTA